MRNSQAGVIDPMQVDAPPEENDNNEEELYEVDVDSFVINSIIIPRVIYCNNYKNSNSNLWLGFRGLCKQLSWFGTHL